MNNSLLNNEGINEIINSDVFAEVLSRDNYYEEVIDSNKSKTVIYFSSNGIYFPNTIDAFSKEIYQNDKFELSNPRNQIKNSAKNVYIRDIYKQWYFKGINKNINTIDKLIEFVSNNYDPNDLTLVGISSGGYIASLIGSVINANRVFNFSGQFDLIKHALKNKKTINQNPILREYQNHPDFQSYYNLSSFLKNSETKIYYFSGINKWDLPQYELFNKYENVISYRIKTELHGVPFPIIALPKILNLDDQELISLSNRMSDKTSVFKFLSLIYPKHELFTKVLPFYFRKIKKKFI